ncbi:hypothetical protein FO519_007477 [Halicephalobus sp. NKZ332]|nr:hypothetical protein FO519_007477 [Halicephalobus sp. NKZ332]
MFQGTDCDPIEYPVPNLTLFVQDVLGKRCVDPVIVPPTVFMYGLILVLGFFGNICTCVVIAKNKSMQNPTNYYLFSLAIRLPVELYGVFVPLYPSQSGELMCKLRAFLVEFTSYASVLTITCFSIERWLAICFPLKAQVFSTLRRVSRVIVGLWICAFLAASPVVFLVVINRVPLPEEFKSFISPGITADNKTIINTDYCSMDNSRLNDQKRLIYSSFFFFFLLPALLISLVYCHIVVELNTANDYLQSRDRFALRSSKKNRKSVLRILVAVVLMFFICWFPFHVQRLMTVFLNERADEERGSEKELITKIWTLTFYISGYCYYSNSACNPILYNIFSEKFRIAFCRMILGEKMTNKVLLLRRNDLRTPRNSSRKAPSASSIGAPSKGSIKVLRENSAKILSEGTVKTPGNKNPNMVIRPLLEDDEKQEEINEFIDTEIS